MWIDEESYSFESVVIALRTCADTIYYIVTDLICLIL